MEVNLNRAEQMLFALLRASLHRQDVDTSCFEGIEASDWKQCYQLAARQGVMALAWDGAMMLPKHFQPAKGLKLTWAMAVEQYEQQHARYCKTVKVLADEYRKHGITTVQLKGVGLSTYYPVPSHREGGDIDIYTYSADTQRLSHQEANTLADRLMERRGLVVDRHSPKHSNFNFQGVPIENHKTFLNVELYPVAVQVESLLRKTINPQPTELPHEAGSILTPSPAFNTLFLALHAAQHYGSGLALHHLCDWAVLLSRHGLQLPSELTDKHFLRCIATFNYLCNQFLGTSVPQTGGEELAAEMLDYILHPPYAEKHVPIQGYINIFMYKTKRFLHRNRLNNQVLYVPLWKRIWRSIVIHVRRPDIIFDPDPL